MKINVKSFSSIRRGILAALASIALAVTTLAISAPSASASTTKSCVTKYQGKAGKWFEVDSMYVKRYTSYGKWKYKVTTSKKRTVTYRTNTGSTRYMAHHPEYVQMSYNIYYKPQTVWYDDSITFTGINSGMDFKFVAHIIDNQVNKKLTCKVYF